MAKNHAYPMIRSVVLVLLAINAVIKHTMPWAHNVVESVGAMAQNVAQVLLVTFVAMAANIGTAKVSLLVDKSHAFQMIQFVVLVLLATNAAIKHTIPWVHNVVENVGKMGQHVAKVRHVICVATKHIMPLVQNAVESVGQMALYVLKEPLATFVAMAVNIGIAKVSLLVVRKHAGMMGLYVLSGQLVTRVATPTRIGGVRQ